MSDVNIVIEPIEESVNITVDESVVEVNVTVEQIETAVNVFVGGGAVNVKRTDGSIIDTVEGPADFTVPNSTVTVKNTLGVTVDTVIVQADDVADGIAPDATVQLNGAAFQSPKSNETINVLTKDQDGNTYAPSVAGLTLTFTKPRDTQIRFPFIAGESLTPLFTIDSFTAGVFTSASSDGSSGTITWSKNGGAYSAIGTTTLVAGDTIRAQRTITTAVGYATAIGTYS